MTMAGKQEDKDMYDDVVIPAHLRAQARCDGESAAPLSTDDYFSHARWIFVRKKGPVHPRSEIASMLRASDWRHGTTHSLKPININYGPVELRLRKLLALFNWRRWWR